MLRKQQNCFLLGLHPGPCCLRYCPRPRSRLGNDTNLCRGFPVYVDDLCLFHSLRYLRRTQLNGPLWDPHHQNVINNFLKQLMSHGTCGFCFDFPTNFHFQNSSFLHNTCRCIIVSMLSYNVWQPYTDD